MASTVNGYRSRYNVLIRMSAFASDTILTIGSACNRIQSRTCTLGTNKLYDRTCNLLAE